MDTKHIKKTGTYEDDDPETSGREEQVDPDSI